MFEKFPSLTRFSHGWTITEKLDGSNAGLIIVPYDRHNLQLTDGGSGLGLGDDQQPLEHVIAIINGMAVLAQSRNKLIWPGKTTDNLGFAQFVKDNAEALVTTLGEGRHYGEWVGKGVQKRHYNLNTKVFALFNTHRWTGVELPDRVRVVPVLAEGYMGEPGAEFERVMSQLKDQGSGFSAGFMDPEGIVMRHGPSGTLFKKTFDYDEQGKWAENEARRAAS